MAKVKYHYCKVGTIPSRIQLFRAYKIRLGLRIKFRKKGEHNWQIGWVHEVHEDGYFKLTLSPYDFSKRVQLPHLPER